MIFHENRLLADDSHVILYLIFVKNWENVTKFVVCCCRGALRANLYLLSLFHSFRRLLPGKMASSPKATYSTSDIAIENPGYMTANISVADDTR